MRFAREAAAGFGEISHAMSEKQEEPPAPDKQPKSAAEHVPWRPKNKLGFALGVGTILVNVLLIVHVVQSKTDQPLEHGLDGGKGLFIGAVMIVLGILLAVRNRHS
jgi:hypothetical protein